MIVAEFLMVSDGAHEIETLWRVLQTSKTTFNKIDILRIDGIRCRAVWKEHPTESDQTILEESGAACCSMDSRKLSYSVKSWESGKYVKLSVVPSPMSTVRI